MTYYNIHSHSPSAHPNEVTIVNKVIREKGSKGEEDEEGSFLSVGIHPWYIEDIESQICRLKGFAMLPEVVAIGEAGLDKLIETPFETQQYVFSLQANLAEEIRKPLIIHCVKAWQELMALKKQLKSQIPWIIHGFRGKPDLAEQLIRQDFYLSFGEHSNPNSLPIAYPNHLFMETDDKAISIQTVYQQAASTLGLSAASLSEQIRENVHAVFLNSIL